MYRKLESWWNARTPVYLHNGSKENFVFQLALIALIIFGYAVKDKYTERQQAKKYNTDSTSE